MVESPFENKISFYFHIPFCTRKCDYCHFYVLPDRLNLKDQLMEGFAMEWQKTLPLLKGKTVQTIYFGGGTPSLFGPEKIQEILSWITSSLSHENLEITLEVNPENATLEKMKEYAAAGINRVSMGVQTFEESLLPLLGRMHSAHDAFRAVESCSRAGISNISIDLMFDLPNQSLTNWHHTLNRAISLPITHLSLYNLTIEPHTVFFKHQKELRALLPSEDVSARMYLDAVKILCEAGLSQYEISAFSKPGKESRHNQGYWTGRWFWGFGPSAFSYWNHKRFRNIANLSRYTKALKQQQSPVDFEEELHPEAKIRELLAIHLRLIQGCHLPDFESRHGELHHTTKESIASLVKEGYLLETGPFLHLSEKGILFYDTVAAEII